MRASGPPSTLLPGPFPRWPPGATRTARKWRRRAGAFRAALANSRWHIEALGAYFGYVRHPFAGDSAVAVAERLAREAGIVTVPGSYFGTGQEPFLRLAFRQCRRSDDCASGEPAALRLRPKAH